jgi:hypothetical protein
VITAEVVSRLDGSRPTNVQPPRNEHGVDQQDADVLGDAHDDDADARQDRPEDEDRQQAKQRHPRSDDEDLVQHHRQPRVVERFEQGTEELARPGRARTPPRSPPTRRRSLGSRRSDSSVNITTAAMTYLVSGSQK